MEICELSNEEKKAIKDCDTIFICLDDVMSEESANYYRKSYLTLTNLIEKQSKEIEELRDMKKELTERVLRLESDKFWDNVVSKDKIKAKIEYYEKIDNAVGVRILESLLKKEFPVTITKEELEKRWKE